MAKNTKIRLIPFWFLSVFLSICALGTITYKWLDFQRVQSAQTNVVKNKQDLSAHLQNLKIVDSNSHENMFLIPTGYFIQSLAFETPTDVNITGYVWQKYPSNYPEDRVKGFVFPEEVSSGSSVIKEAYRQDISENDNNYVLIGWYIDVTLRQTFDYSKYPLDILTVWLRIWQQDSFSYHDTLLVPDFEAYQDIKKIKLGLDADIVHGEWSIDETFFSYVKNPYDTTFGFENGKNITSPSELYINIGLRREFINAFIINLVPLFIVMLLLYSQVMIVSRHKEQADKFGFNTSGVIATCSALFFVVLLAHIQVREMFQGSGLVYIEYFYLTLYAVILMTALNAYIFTLQESSFYKIIHYRDNLVTKVIFWPLVLWVIAIITCIKI